MFSLFGDIALIFALVFAILQCVLPLWGYYKNNSFLMAFARPAAFGQAIYVLMAYLLLTIAFAQNNFSLAYVAANSHPQLPLLYRLAAVWGAHEGSILLWILILNSWTFAFALLTYEKKSLIDKKFAALTLAILGLISCGFLTFLLFTSNPFLAATTLQTGRDLNPLLQDPGFIIHPPMLYIGYVGFSIAFALTQAALLRGELNAAWAQLTRRFALIAWCFLTLGIALGSWWAYRVLGWGGFWFWDPVENASLLPWLAGLALIHILILVEKRDLAKHWAVLLAICTFALSLIGTFLVRSGVLVSAHTFANDPDRGLFLLLILAIVVAIALTIYALRMPNTTQSFFSRPIFSRELMLLINSTLLFIAMLTILLGTLYPLILDAFHFNAISVGAPYFNKVMLPQVFLIMFFMGWISFTAWEKKIILPWKKILLKMLISISSAALILWCIPEEINSLALFCLSLSIWIMLNTFHLWRNAPGMTFAHIGFAILIIGIMLSSLLNQEREIRIKVGEVTQIGPYYFNFLSTQGLQGPNYRGIRANFEISKNNHHITYLQPEKRIYLVREMVMTKVAIHPGLFRDLYLALGELFAENDWSIRLYYKPFIRWIWFGAFIMMMGGLLSLQQRKRLL